MAWIGHPNDLSGVLKKMIDNKWNVQEALEERNDNIQLDTLISDARYLILAYQFELNKLKINNAEKAILVLNKVNEIVQKEPKLKNAGLDKYYNFNSLLYIDQKKAYDYGKSMLTYKDNKHLHDDIIESIIFNEDSLKIQPEIYHLGAEAYREKIKNVDDPELEDTYKYYNNMAKWYWKAGERSKAIEAQQKSIKVLKSKQNFSESDLNVLKAQLEQFKKENNK